MWFGSAILGGPMEEPLSCTARRWENILTGNAVASTVDCRSVYSAAEREWVWHRAFHGSPLLLGLSPGVHVGPKCFIRVFLT